MDADVENMFRPFQEKDKGKQFRSFTDIPKISKIDLTEAWVHDAVSDGFLFLLDGICVSFIC